MSIEFRHADFGDTEAIAEAIRESFKDVADRFKITKENVPSHPSNCTAEWIQRDMESGSEYLLAEMDGTVVGCVACKTIDPNTLEAQRLAVIPGYRGGYLARRLNEAVFNHAVDAGLERIRIAIVAQHCALKRWYLRMGFVERETLEFEHLPFKVTYLEYEVAGRN